MKNADLSNFSEQPGEFNEANYKNVESAFQAQKLNFSDVFHYPDFGGPNDVYFEMQEKFENISGAKARKLGKSIPELDRNAWDKAKYGIMKEVIKESFK